MKIFSLLLVGILISLQAMAGGISGGGGGTTNPQPTQPESIAVSVEKYGASALLAWVNQAEYQFLRTKTEDRPTHPYKKLFTGDKTIFDILQNAKVEVRFTRPCFDANGKPWDGSVYADTPGAVCLSAFTMAPKLGDLNVKDETLALLLHELSHLTGTSEEEAQAIQNQVLRDFRTIDIEDFATVPKMSAAWFKEVLKYLNIFISHPNHLGVRQMADLREQLTVVWKEANFRGKSFSLLTAATTGKFLPSETLLRAVEEYLCANDKGENSERRVECQKRIDRSFQNDEVVSARTYISRWQDSPFENPNPNYDRLMIRRMRGTSGLVLNLEEVRKVFLAMQADMDSHRDAKMELVRR